MPESTQHPDGGVREVQWCVAHDRPYETCRAECLSVALKGHGGDWPRLRECWEDSIPYEALPVAQAARLIDVADPKVRERAIEAVKPWMTRSEKVDAIIAALQKGAPE